MKKLSYILVLLTWLFLADYAIIPSSSALIRTTGSTYHEFTVSGANHLEMKNHAGIKVCIEDEIDRYMSAQTIIGPVFPIL